MHQHLALVGLPGVGKSTVGRVVSRRLGFAFVDLDSVIGEQAGMTIPEIFAEFGEERFRDLECEALGSVCERGRPTVIATGGGVIGREENRQRLQDSVWTVWLRSEIPVLVERVSRNRNRPLTANDPQEVLERLKAQRHGLYEATAHATIDIDDLTIDQAAGCVTELALRARVGASGDNAGECT